MVSERDCEPERKTGPIKAFPLPPADFNPLTAPAAALLRYGIMRRPNRRHQPVLYERWLRLFGPPVSFVAPDSLLLRGVAPGLAFTAPPQGGATATTRYDSSRNWSGAYIVPTGGRMFVQVAGVWTVPTPMLPPIAERVPGDPDYACSMWVGLDGQRRYRNSTLPQIGTTQTLTLGAVGAPLVRVSAFFQWWDPQTGGVLTGLTGLAVSPGDLMLGSVWANTASSVIAYLRNLSTGQITILGCAAPHIAPASDPIAVSGATAEWILERPTELGRTRLHPFPDYGSTMFSECWAGLALHAGPPQAVENVATPRFIRMYDVLNDPSRTTLISMPHRHSDTALRLTYGGF